MRLAFIDFTYAYDAARPDSDQPVGGTTAAVCFLAREMARKAIACTFFNRVAEPCSAYGITTLPLQDLAHEVGDAYDAYIFCGRWTQELVGLVRAHTQKPLIGWMHESVFAPPFTSALPELDAVVFVSQWQQRINQHLVQPHWQQIVIRNAMSPAIAAQFMPHESIRAAKSQPPLVLFAGHFARGAFHMPEVIARMAEKRGNFDVEIFCNEDPSPDADANARYINWMRNLPHVKKVGKASKQDFIRTLRRATLLLAPNPWPETSCVVLIEALASGMDAIITERAALPETAAGFARQIPIEHANDPTRFDIKIDYDLFAGAALDALNDMEQNPTVAEQKLRHQVDFFTTHYQWVHRVAPWVEFIENIK